MIARVVILSRDPALAADELRDVAGAEVHGIRVASPYEAAAEMLAAPVSVLLADLRSLSRRHLRLLEIARELDVEILAVGTLPSGLTAEQLSGVRLLSMRDLPAAIARVSSPAEEAAPVTGERVPAAHPVRLTPAKPQAEEPAEIDSNDLGKLLTPEEIAALLGSDQ